MKKLLRILAPALFAAAAAAANASGTASIEIRGHSASVAVAETKDELQHGLMGVQAMPENQGMFSFSDKRFMVHVDERHAAPAFCRFL